MYSLPLSLSTFYKILWQNNLKMTRNRYLFSHRDDVQNILYRFANYWDVKLYGFSNLQNTKIWKVIGLHIFPNNIPFSFLVPHPSRVALRGLELLSGFLSKMWKFIRPFMKSPLKGYFNTENRKRAQISK